MDELRPVLRNLAETWDELGRARQRGRTGEPPPRERGQAAARPWVPFADVFARGSDLVIQVELPGVQPEDVVITDAAGTLTISGLAPSELDGGDSTAYVRERASGAFRRSLPLPAGIDEERISASFEHGVVEVVVQGAAATVEPRRIPLRRATPG